MNSSHSSSVCGALSCVSPTIGASNKLRLTSRQAQPTGVLGWGRSLGLVAWHTQYR